jgi:hypothetical protein
LYDVQNKDSNKAGIRIIQCKIFSWESPKILIFSMNNLMQENVINIFVVFQPGLPIHALLQSLETQNLIVYPLILYKPSIIELSHF